MVVILKEREARYKRIRQRAEERHDDEAFWIKPHDSSSTSPVPVAAAATLPADAPATAVKAAQYQRPVPPRPRKQGKRR
jgi:hypothetical protein